jgi:DNA-directed RNA polymerase subunit delta
MSIKKMKKEDLEVMSYKDITYLLLEEDGKDTTLNLFQKIVKLLELPESELESKIGDYFTSLSTDKRFILLDDGMWDIRTKHPKKNIVIEDDLDDIDEVELEEMDETDQEEEDDNTNLDSFDEDDVDSDDEDEYKDLIIVDEEELNVEE